MAGFSSTIAGTGRSSAGAIAAAHNIISNATARNAYYPPAPVYTPPQRQYSYEPVYTPPKATYTPKPATNVVRPTPAPAPAPIKSTVQQIIDKAVAAPKPAAAPAVDPVAAALKNQSATVAPWQGMGTGNAGTIAPLYRQASQGGAVPHQIDQLAAANQLYDLDNINAMIALAQDQENQNYVPGMGYFPDSQAPDEGPPNDLLALMDARAGILNPGNTGLSGTLSSISNAGVPALINGANWFEGNIEDPLLDGIGLGNEPWSPRPDQAGQVYGDGTGGPSYIGNQREPSSQPQMLDGNRTFNRPPQGMPLAPDPYDTGVMFWDPTTQTPIRIYPDDVPDFYGAMYGIDVNPPSILDQVGEVGGLYGNFVSDLAGAVGDYLGGGGSYGGGSGGSYGGGDAY